MQTSHWCLACFFNRQLVNPGWQCSLCRGWTTGQDDQARCPPTVQYQRLWARSPPTSVLPKFEISQAENTIHQVSPPQMPVPLNRMSNAIIPRAEITTFVPSCPPMLHTIIKPELSFFKNCFENGMLTFCVLSYAPMLVKRSVLPRSPEIFLRPFPEKTQILLTACVHAKISHL